MEQIVPYQARLVVPIRENDKRFMQLQELIDAKKNMLVNKQKKFGGIFLNIFPEYLSKKLLV